MEYIQQRRDKVCPGVAYQWLKAINDALPTFCLTYMLDKPCAKPSLA